MTVRPASVADAERLLAWRNDPQTRAWSRTTTPVTQDEHRTWLDRVLATPDRHLLIAEQHSEPVGTVRFDRDDAGWEVSITLAPDARGRGLAVPVLLAAERFLDAPTTIVATVHRDNAASMALFQRAGYQVDTNDGDWVRLGKSLSGVS